MVNDKGTTLRRDRRVMCWLWRILATAVVAVILYMGIYYLARRPALASLPALPNLTNHSRAVAQHLREADRAARRRPNDAESIGMLAMAYHADGFYEHALYCYTVAQAHGPTNWKWIYYPSLLDEHLGNTRAVVEHLHAVLAKKDDLALAWYRLGDAEFKLDRYEEADQAYRQAMSTDPTRRVPDSASPDSPDWSTRRFPIGDYALLGLARVALVGGQAEAARQFLKQVIDQSPDFGPAHSMLGRVLAQLGDDEKARRHHKRANVLTRYLPPADPMLDILIRESHNTRVLRKYAQLAQANGNVSRARFLTRLAMEVDPDGCDDAQNMGLLLFDLDLKTEAIPYLRRHLETKGQTHRFGTMHRFALCLIGSGQTGEAETYLRGAIERHPNVREFYNDLGALHASQSKHDEAIRYYQMALEVDSDFDEAHNNLGVAMAATGHFEEAMGHYRRALHIEPEYPDAHYNLALLLQHQKKLEAAISHYRQALSTNPKHFKTLISLGLALQSQGKLHEAIQQNRLAIQLEPNSAAAQNNLGAVLFAVGSFDEALHHYHRALELEPEFAAARYNLGEVFQVTGELDRAIEAYGRAARLMPQSPLPLNAMAWLLATHPNADSRQPGKAMHFAKKATELSEHRNPIILDTLAACFAVTGKFDRAAKTAQKAITLAESNGSQKVASRIRERLALYKQDRPYRSPLLASSGIASLEYEVSGPDGP